MGVPIGSYNPSHGLEMLKLALAEKNANENTPGRVPSGIAENAYASSMPNTSEQEREYQSMKASDEGAAKRYQDQQDEWGAQDALESQARTMGYESPAAAHTAGVNEKLRQVLLPEQVKLEAATREREAAREFSASQNDLNRQSRMDAANVTQNGQNGRQATTQAGVQSRFNQLHPPSMMDKLKGVFGMGTPAAPSGPVTMQSPDGQETQVVPPERVQEFLARGAKIVQ